MNSSAARRALVTGGTSGIGLGISRALAASGMAVTVTGTQPPDRYGAALDGLPALRLDLREGGAVEGLLSEWNDQPLDLLVNAVGTVAYGGAEFDAATFRDVCAVNLAGPQEICTALFPLLAASAAAGRGGNIVNIASLASFRATPENPAYAASKAGLVMLTRSLAVAWGRYGVRVNAVAPGFVATKLTTVSSERPEIRDRITRRTPLGRWGTAEDVAGCVEFLASPAAAFITGVIIPVDGGLSLAL